MTTHTRMNESPDLPLWVKISIGLAGSFLLLPFVMPAVSLMLLAALPVFVVFVPWAWMNVRPVTEVKSHGLVPLRSLRVRHIGQRPFGRRGHAHA
jgi:hypothetical protein